MGFNAVSATNAIHSHRSHDYKTKIKIHTSVHVSHVSIKLPNEMLTIKKMYERVSHSRIHDVINTINFYEN